MRTKNAKKISGDEREHLRLVKLCPCSVCQARPPSAAHHIVQGDHYTTVALCDDCHQGSFNGLHGQKRMWQIMKITELGALNVTIHNVIALIRSGA